MSEGPFPHVSPARTCAAFLLFVALGPEPVWLSLRIRPPAPDPGMGTSVAALIVWPERMLLEFPRI